jgi:5-methyltetrahydropteroyltriglutamate--homocysteine methyltransferase
MGIFPRSNELISLWKRYDAGTSEETEFKKGLEVSIKSVINLQVNAGLTYIHDPYIDWHDLFRPFTYLENIEVGPITRYYENNVFYKKPVFKGIPIYPEGFISKFLHREYLPPNHKLIITLPGPYTFYNLSEFENGFDPVYSVVHVIEEAINDAKHLGYSRIILAEPEIAYSNDIDSELLRELYLRLRKYSDILWIHLFFGDISGKVDLIESLPISRYSIDMQYTNPFKI